MDPSISQESETRSALLNALAREAAAAPYARKLIVARRYGDALETLRALARSGVPWLGFEATTPKRIALELLGNEQNGLSARLIDEFDEQALIDEAIDATLADPAGAHYAHLGEGVGLRRSLARALQALRLGGIRADTVLDRLEDADKRNALTVMLRTYEQLLASRDRIDAAVLFAQALTALDAGPVLQGARLYVLPGQTLRGVSGRLVARLLERGAVVLDDDAPRGLARPPARVAAPAPDITATPLAHMHEPAHPGVAGSIDIFAATGIEIELREVLRRITAAGVPWDDAEIVATDPETYAVALDALARRLDVPVSFATGLPVARTRPGRVIATYLRWIEDDFREDVIRGLIERGDIVATEGSFMGPTLARRLRTLRVGRGRERYAATIDAALRALDLPHSDEDDRAPEEIEAARARERAQLLALRSLLDPILAATPDLGSSAERADVRLSAGSLARGVAAMLALARADTEVDRTAKERLSERLARAAETLTRATTLRGARAALEEKLDDRVPAPEASGRAPWLSAGGHLHFVDLDGAGLTGRKHTFVVGLDAGRFPDTGAGDAMLSDADRRQLAAGQVSFSLATSTERIEERRYALASALARMRGRVTLSYAAWSAAEGRSVGPSADLLQAFRLQQGNPHSNYDDLQEALHPYASAVAGEARIDTNDVWLQALDADGVLRRGDAQIAQAYPQLASGVAAHAARMGDVAGPHLGILRPRPVFDLRTWTRPLSASRLQALGTCPHRFLIMHVLGVRPPDDQKAEPGRWLNALDRGAVLHDVFEQTLRRARAAGITEIAAFADTAQSVLAEAIAERKEKQPPPGPAVYEAETTSLRADVRAFVHLFFAQPRDWIDLEARFGYGDDIAELPLPNGALRIFGQIDRIDRLEDGRVAVVDYKTGSLFPFRRETRVYAGGRRLQHALYTAGAEHLGHGDVAAVEYHFPGERGRNEIVRYTRRDVQDAGELLEQLLAGAAAGYFPPTNDAREDCMFCDVRAVCRVRGERERVTSLSAAWTARVWDSDLEALRALRALRDWS